MYTNRDDYGDRGFGGGYRREESMPENVVINAFYEQEWPEGYWEKYDQLRKLAEEVSSAAYLNMVMRQDGRYHVRAMVQSMNYINGPETSDRNEAWQLFIDAILELKSTTAVTSAQLTVVPRKGKKAKS